MRKNIFYVVLFVACLGFSCSKDSASTTSSVAGGIGTGGSLARFTIVGNYLYLADYNTIETYDISSPDATIKKSSVNVGFGVETIFPYKDKLFIGSQEGMFIYSLANPMLPVKLGAALHVRTCDPVVANDSIAYVTLRGSGVCGAPQDGLFIYNIETVTAPVQKAVLPLSSPYGLGLKDTVVFICRAAQGLTVVNVKQTTAPKIMYTKNDGNYLDVIVYDNLLICYVSTGLVLYDISNLNQIVKIGTYNY